MQLLYFLPVVYSGFSELLSCDQGGHKPGKPGILRDFSERGKLREFCATSEKNCNKVFLVRHSNICVKIAADWVNMIIRNRDEVIVRW